MTQKQIEAYDVCVIGAGPGGYVAAIRAAQLGLKTVCIERHKTLGGTCLNVGCIPSKALLQSSEHFAFLKHHGKEHGINCQDISLDFPKIMERKTNIIKGLVDGISGLFKRNNITHLKGMAKFTSVNSIEITNENEIQHLSAKHFILATGSEPIALPFLPFNETTVVSSTGALALAEVPKKLVVIGGGVIGVELASVYNRLGSDVTVIEMLDQICIAMDASISKGLLQALKKQGLQFHLGAKVSKADVIDQMVHLQVLHGEEAFSLSADVVLVAVGRRPYSKGLNLEGIGIQTDKRGFVPVDANFRTSVSPIFAIGDLIDGPMLAHRASEEGAAVAEIIAGQKPHLQYMAIPNVIYTHPEAAAVGLTEQEALELKRELLIGICAFRGNPRARCIGDTDGSVKVIGDAATGRLLGMHILGPQASELISEGVLAIEKHATLEEIANACHAHPTLSEAIKEACLYALGRAIH